MLHRETKRSNALIEGALFRPLFPPEGNCVWVFVQPVRELWCGLSEVGMELNQILCQYETQYICVLAAVKEQCLLSPGESLGPVNFLKEDDSCMSFCRTRGFFLPGSNAFLILALPFI